MVIIALGPHYSFKQTNSNNNQSQRLNSSSSASSSSSSSASSPPSTSSSSSSSSSSDQNYQSISSSSSSDPNRQIPSYSSSPSNPSYQTNLIATDSSSDGCTSLRPSAFSAMSNPTLVTTQQQSFFQRPTSLSLSSSSSPSLNLSHQHSVSVSTLELSTSKPQPYQAQQQQRSMLSTGSIRTIGLRSNKSPSNSNSAYQPYDQQTSPSSTRKISSSTINLLSSSPAQTQSLTPRASSSFQPHNNHNRYLPSSYHPSSITQSGSSHPSPQTPSPFSPTSSSSSSSSSSLSKQSPPQQSAQPTNLSCLLPENLSPGLNPAFKHHTAQTAHENNLIHPLSRDSSSTNGGNSIEPDHLLIQCDHFSNSYQKSADQPTASSSDFKPESRTQSLARRDDHLSTLRISNSNLDPSNQFSSLPAPTSSSTFSAMANELLSKPSTSLSAPLSPSQQKYQPTALSNLSNSSVSCSILSNHYSQMTSQNQILSSQTSGPALTAVSENFTSKGAALSSVSGNDLPWCPSDMVSCHSGSHPVIMPPINSFHHRPSIASVVREKRLKACLAQLVTDTSASSSKSLIGSSLNLKNSSIQTVPVRLQALDRKSRSRGCTRMGGLPDLNMNTCFDTLKRPPIRRLLSENLTDSAVNRSPNLNSPSTIISFEESVLETQKLSKDNIKLSAVSVTSLGRGLGEVVMTPTTEEWWSLDRLSDGSRKPDGQDELTVQGGSDGSQMGDDDEAEDLSDESGSSCSTDSFLRSSTAALTSEVQNTRVTCDSDKYLNSSGPLISPKLRHDVLSSDCKDLNPVAESSPAAALNSDPGDLSVEITSDGVHPVEPEPTIGFPTLTSVNGIIHMPPTPEDEEDLQLGNSSYKSNADLAVSSQQTNSPKDQTSSLPRSSAAILSSFLENGQLKFNSHPQTSITTRPCSLVHDGVVRKPVDPRSYSAITGYRSIHSFALDSEAGRGAYGIVKNAREKGPDGQPVGPPLIIKYIIKQKILADCWKRHKILGPIPIEIHVLDHFRRVNYRPSRVATAKKYIEDAKALGKAKELKVIPLKIDSAIPTTSPSSPTNPTSQRTGHPNICGILDYFEDPDYYYLVMPRFGGGKDLFDHVEKSPEGLKIEEVRRIFAQLVDGLAFLHERNVVHRDLKDENVILDEEGNIQLIDFGSAAYIREGMKFETFSGTLDFAAPEVLRGERHGGKEIDIWALGVLLYVLICGECPFWNPDEASRGIEAGTRAEEALRMKPEIDSLAIDLLKNCLRLEPAKRPLAEEICWHEFLVGEGGWKGSVPPTVLAPLMNEI